MEFDAPNGDFGNRTRCGGNGISGMRSVIATVSGYHGTERFLLIKLIAETGASYVGALSKSTTHLVCWELKGKKFDLANNLGIKVISHQWFEDCLKEGRCVPEDPYTMKCGKQVRPLSWKVPDASLDGKKYEVALGKRKILDDRSNTFRCHGNVEISPHSSDVKHLERSHPYSASNKKIPACPLCKAIFTSIMKVEGAASCDQKIFSQTIPEIASSTDFFICPDREETTAISPRESICSECRHHEPEDLLLNCHVCAGQWVHSCCLDPPLVPWTCVHCRDLRMLYQLYR